jgi:hypothetical protein
VVLVGQRKALAIAVKGGRARWRWSKLREWLIGSDRPSAAALMRQLGVHWEAGPNLTEIYVDGTACPVREEIYRVAAHLRVNVFVVCNGSRPIRPPDTPKVKMVLVSDAGDQCLVTAGITNCPGAAPPVVSISTAVNRPSVTRLGAPPGICVSSAEIAQHHEMRRHENAFHSSVRLHKSTSTRTWRKIPAIGRAMN